jgi:hypothetical protein
MYVFQLAVEYLCSRCDYGITAPENAQQLICPICHTVQAAHRSRLRHFQMWGGEVGRQKAQVEILLRNSERQRLLELRRKHWLVRLVCGAIFRRFGVVRAISEQLEAVELRLKQCKERATALE